MSHNRVATVAELVEKYRNNNPELKRAHLRRLIRIENPKLFLKESNPSWVSNLRKLDRKLKPLFQEPSATVKRGEGVIAAKQTLRYNRKERRRAREAYINGETAKAIRLMEMLVQVIPEERQTANMKSLMLISPTFRKSSPLLRKINRLIPQVLNELEAIAISTNTCVKKGL